MFRRDFWPWAAAIAAVGVAVVPALSCGGGGSPSSSTPPVTATPTPAPSPGGGVGAASCPLGKGSGQAVCSRGKTSSLLVDVDAAIEQVAQQKPAVVDVNNQARRGSGRYKVLDAKGVVEGVAAALRAAGNCAQPDWDRPLEAVQVKKSNDESEDFDLVSSDGYLRRGSDSYRQTCTPAAFPVDPDPDGPPYGSGCGRPYPPPVAYFDAKIHMRNPRYYTLDSTAKVGPDFNYCLSIGYTDGRSYCAVRPEGSPERAACELWRVGRAEDTGHPGPTWTLDGHRCTGPASGCENQPGNQYQLLAYSGGVYRMCGKNGACGKVKVTR